MEINRMIALYMGYCHSRQLRKKTMLSYEQSLKLFAVRLQETEGVTQVEQIKEGNIRRYIIELQTRGKYTFYARKNSQAENEAKRRRDYNDQITNVTINNYLRNIRPFFSWLLAGMDIYTLSRVLGHSSVKVTEQAYLDVYDTELKGRYYKFSPLDHIYYGGTL